MSTKRIAAIGGGNMAEAIIRGSIRTARLEAAGWVVAEPREERRALFSSLGVDAVPTAADLTPHLDDESQILLAVKPQMLPAVAADLAAVPLSRTVVSILAGSTTDGIRTACTDAGNASASGMRVVRVMPNTPCAIGEGMAALACGDGTSEADTTLAKGLFGALGEIIEIDESLMDAFTAVAGSGPAYVFHLAEAMTRGAEAAGFSAGEAAFIVRQTVAGAARLLRDSEVSAADLRVAVTSPGGTTAAALQELDSSATGDAMVRAIIAARDRGRELAGS